MLWLTAYAVTLAGLLTFILTPRNPPADVAVVVPGTRRS